MRIDRSETSRALAKAIAYQECGKAREAEKWAVELVRLLACADIVRPALLAELHVEASAGAMAR